MAAKNIVQQFRRATQKRYSAEEKIHIVVEGLCGEVPVTEICWREGISTVNSYRWSKALLDVGNNGQTRGITAL